MGLDATVFLNEKNLTKSIPPSAYSLDEKTGEYSTIEEYDHRFEEFQACHRRLTNMGGAAELRQQLAALGAPAGGILLMQVLYSGTHCGDYISMADLPRLELEIAAIGLPSDGLTTSFLRDMQDLLAAAREQGNPIVFV